MKDQPETTVGLHEPMTWTKDKTILLVEDEAILALSESKTLRWYGFHVIIVTNGASALDQVRNNPKIDLVLMDINLGQGKDGIELAREMMAIRELPIVFLSSHTEWEVAEKAGTVTSYGYVVKGSPETVLLNAVKTALLLHSVHYRLVDREKALLENERLLIATLHSIGDGVVSTDRDGRVTDMNGVAEHLTGWTAAEAKGRPVEDIFRIVSSQNGEELENPVKRVLREGTAAVLSNHAALVARDGSRKQIADSGAPIRDDSGTIVGVVFVFRDVTEERRLQDEITQSAERLQTFFTNTHIGIYRSTPDGRILMVNPALLAMLRYDSFEELATRNLERQGFDSTYERQTFKSIMERDGRVIGHEARWERKDGTSLWVRESAVAVRDASGAILWYDGTVEDFTERRHTEEALVQSEQRYRLMTEHSSDIVWQTDGALIVRYVNKADERVRGYQRNEVMGTPLLSMFTPSGSASVRELLTSLEAETNGAGPRLCEAEIIRKTGEHLWVEVSVDPIPGGAGMPRGFHGVIRDISERKRSQEALSRAVEEREGLYKELQHRVKNSMAMIAGLVGLEANRTAAGETKTSLENIRDRVRSVAALYEMLSETENANDVRLDEYVKKLVCSLSKAYLHENSEVVLQVVADPVVLNARRAASFGIIVNELVTNSLKHGVRPGAAGVIRVEVRHVQDDISLEVSDTGEGLPAGFALARAGGLGLQLVQMLVEQLGGFITCAEGINARFHVQVPCRE